MGVWGGCVREGGWRGRKDGRIGKLEGGYRLREREEWGSLEGEEGWKERWQTVQGWEWEG